jgi:phage shock protein C
VNEVRRLYRSETDRMLGGVCGGLGAFFGIDPTLVRVLFIVLTFGGVGPLLYLAMWILVPRQSRVGAQPDVVAREAVDEIRDKTRRGADEARTAYRRWRSGSPPPGGGPGPADEPPPSAPEEP